MNNKSLAGGHVLPLGPEWLGYIVNHQSMYHESMHSSYSDFESFPYGYRWGYFIDPNETESLVGWILFSDDTSTSVYCEDVAVLPEWQRHGIMKALTKHAYRELRWLGKDIHMHCRKASYPSPAFLFHCGYEITSDVLVLDHYIHEYGLEKDEILRGEDYDAHELLLRPIGVYNHDQN